MKIYLTIVIVIFYTIFLAAQDNLQFERLTSEDGLSQSTIYKIIQDQKGYIWFATANGLNKFDGYDFTVFSNKPSDPSSISDNSITALMEDNEGIIWAGTFEGILNRFDRKSGKFTRIHLRNSVTKEPEKINSYDIPASFSMLQNESITSIISDKDNSLWIGTWSNGLVKVDKLTLEQEWFTYSSFNPAGLSSNKITSIAIDSTNAIWIGTYGGGINKVIERKLLLDETESTKTVQSYVFINFDKNPNLNQSLTDDKVLDLIVDNNNRLWIGTFDGGINIFKNSSSSFFQWDAEFETITLLSTNEKQPAVMTILQDKSNLFWLGTFEKGLYRFELNSGNLENFQNDPVDVKSIASNEVISLLKDRSGNLWLGSHLGDGVSKFAQKKFKFGLIGTKSLKTGSLDDGVVWSIFEDSKSNIWLGTYRAGIEVYDKNKNKIKHFSPDPKNPYSINDKHIKSIAEDYQGNFWIGTYSGGLNFYNSIENKFYHYVHDSKNENSIARNHVEDIFIDKENNIWLGIFGGGLSTFNLREFYTTNKIIFKNYKQTNDSTGLSSNRVYSISDDDKSNLWIGTLGGGLNKFDKKKKIFKFYSNSSGNPNSLGDNKVIVSYQDYDGMIWIGTYGGGLNCFNPVTEEFTRYSSDRGLKSDVVYGILEDNYSNLWMSTDAGIFKFNKHDNTFIQYDLYDGLQSLEFSGGAFAKTRNGEMLFGGVNGINYFYPDSIKSNEFLPPIVISKIYLFDTPLPGEFDELNLSYEQNVFSFEFAALDYTNSEENQYAYILEGFENSWNYTSSQNRMAKYIAVTPGNYTFRVKGTNNTGLWNNNGVALSIHISPPFWKTWWFILLSVIFIVGSVSLYVYVRFNHLLAIEKLKTKLAADLHDNIGAGLTEISILSDLTIQKIGNENKGATNNLGNISITSRNLVQSMSDIVWVVNPKRDSLKDLLIRLKDSYSELLNQLGIAFRIRKIDNVDLVKLPMDYRQNLYLIFKEAVNNCIKHSECTQIEIIVETCKNIIKMKLVDNGKGFNQDTRKYGNGLRNMEVRAKSIGGEVKISTEIGIGTSINFTGKIASESGISYFIKKLKF